MKTVVSCILSRFLVDGGGHICPRALPRLDEVVLLEVWNLLGKWHSCLLNLMMASGGDIKATRMQA